MVLGSDIPLTKNILPQNIPTLRDTFQERLRREGNEFIHFEVLTTDKIIFTVEENLTLFITSIDFDFSTVTNGTATIIGFVSKANSTTRYIQTRLAQTSPTLINASKHIFQEYGDYPIKIESGESIFVSRTSGIANIIVRGYKLPKKLV